MKIENNRLRVIALTHGGCEALLESLARTEGVEIAGVFVETEINRRSRGRYEKLRRSIRYEGCAATAAKLLRLRRQRDGSPMSETAQIHAGQKALGELAARLGIPLHYVSNYHTEESIALMRQAEADLGIVWGTNILKESVFKLPRLGSINLHQGLAPYYRGGPSVFWELFNGEREVGMTVHFVEPRVDAGAILAQTTIPLEYDYAHGLDYESFIAGVRKQMKSHCVRLMTEAVKMIADGSAQPRPQDISLGKRYRLPVKREQDELRRRLRARADGAGLSLPARGQMSGAR